MLFFEESLPLPQVHEVDSTTPRPSRQDSSAPAAIKGRQHVPLSVWGDPAGVHKPSQAENSGGSGTPTEWTETTRKVAETTCKRVTRPM